MFRRLAAFFELVKFQHTLFALPFAVLAAARAAGGVPAGWQIGWLLAAMVTARSAAMAFNRIADRRYDAANPRTADRSLPRGALSTAAAAVFTVIMVAGFVMSAAMLNLACLYLTPVALVVVLGYSYAKRFTALSHLWLGLSLSIAPAGAWIGVRGALDEPYPFLLAAAVVFWTAGFDIIYACLDVAFDRAAGLRSIPARIGARPALRVSAALHALFAATLVALGVVEGSGWAWWAGVGVVTALLVYEHAIVKPDDMKRVNEAFFRVNAMVSLLVMLAGIADPAAPASLYLSTAEPIDVVWQDRLLKTMQVAPDRNSLAYNGEYYRVSPDGRRVVDEANGRVALIGETGSVDLGPWATQWTNNGLCDYPVFSPNGRRVACPYSTDRLTLEFTKGPLGLPWLESNSCEMQVPIVDGCRGLTYYQILDIVFSPDSRRVAYLGVNTSGILKTYDVIVDGVPHDTRLDAESSDGRLGAGLPYVLFGPDSRRVAWKEKEDGDRVSLVVDGKKVGVSDEIPDCLFAPGGQGLTWTEKSKDGEWVVLNGKRLGPYQIINTGFLEGGTPEVARLFVSADNSVIGYVARAEDGLEHVFLDGEPQKGFRNVERKSVSMSSDGRTVAYFAHEDGEHSLVVNGQVREKWNGDAQLAKLAVSSNGTRWAYVVCPSSSGNPTPPMLVMDGVKTPLSQLGLDELSSPQMSFSPDGKHVVYVTRRQMEGETLLVDWKPVVRMDWIKERSMKYNPDGTKLAFVARKGRELWWKVIDVK